MIIVLLLLSVFTMHGKYKEPVEEKIESYVVNKAISIEESIVKKLLNSEIELAQKRIEVQVLTIECNQLKSKSHNCKFAIMMTAIATFIFTSIFYRWRIK